MSQVCFLMLARTTWGRKTLFLLTTPRHNSPLRVGTPDRSLEARTEAKDKEGCFYFPPPVPTAQKWHLGWVLLSIKKILSQTCLRTMCAGSNPSIGFPSSYTILAVSSSKKKKELAQCLNRAIFNALIDTHVYCLKPYPELCAKPQYDKALTSSFTWGNNFKENYSWVLQLSVPCPRFCRNAGHLMWYPN